MASSPPYSQSRSLPPPPYSRPHSLPHSLSPRPSRLSLPSETILRTLNKLSHPEDSSSRSMDTSSLPPSLLLPSFRMTPSHLRTQSWTSHHCRTLQTMLRLASAPLAMGKFWTPSKGRFRNSSCEEKRACSPHTLLPPPFFHSSLLPSFQMMPYLQPQTTMTLHCQAH